MAIDQVHAPRLQVFNVTASLTVHANVRCPESYIFNACYWFDEPLHVVS